MQASYPKNTRIALNVKGQRSNVTEI